MAVLLIWSCVGWLGVVTAAPASAAVGDPDFSWAIGVGGVEDDRISDIAVDAAGNSYVVGDFQATVDFDPRPGIAVALASNGFRDGFVAKYNSAGELMWAFSFGDDNTDAVYAVAIDAAGNVNIAGRFSGTVDFDPGPGVTNLTASGSGDVLVAKYDTNGNLMWAFGLPDGSGSALVRDLALDASGSIHISGTFRDTVDFDPGPGTSNLNSAGNQDMFVAEYDSAGNFSSAMRLGDAAYDDAGAVTVDPAGNVLVAGEFRGTVDFDPGQGVNNQTSNGDADMVVAKYDPTGNLIWAFGMGSITNDSPGAITADDNGNILVTGFFSGTMDFDPGPITANVTPNGNADMFLAKYGPNGNLIWVVGAGDGSISLGLDVAFDSSGNAIVSGAFTGVVDFDSGPGVGTTHSASGSGDLEAFVAKYGPTGNLIWAARGGGAQNDYGQAVGVDGADNTYVAGTFADTVDLGTTTFVSAGREDMFLLRVAPIRCHGKLLTMNLNASASTTATSGPDVILGTPNADTINGLSGNDTICAGDGGDTINGGDGNDLIYGENGADIINGNDGGDILFGEAGGDTINGNDGNDRLYGSTGSDTIDGGDGNDNIWGGDDGDTIDGGSGTDRIRGEGGGDLIHGGPDRDIILGQAGADTIFGEGGRDSLYGGDDNDTIDGGLDTDLVRGEGGNDTLLTGTTGNDRLVGGDGDDTLDARLASGSTRMIGDAGDDTFFGSEQLDRMWGYAGDDTMFGGGYNDLLRGGDGNDTIFGQDGRDTLDGGNGNDYLDGGAGNSDKMVGVAGIDTCDGGAGIADFAHSTCETVLGIP